jgi:UDP-2-acetamido-2,6-beta-L-arabino-hexul-4-ose reductase
MVNLKKARVLLTSGQKKRSFYGFNYPKCFLDLLGINYNSVVATFSHKMARNEKPTIDVDGDLKLIYVELVNEILKEIRGK